MAVTVIGEGEQMDVTLSVYQPGESGPDTHVHREHADSFRVLEGELEFDVGREAVRMRVAAGGFVLVPPGVAHTFRNAGTGPARFLNFHAPARGFAAHLRGENDDFDSFDPPAGGGGPATNVVLIERGSAEPRAAQQLSLEELELGSGAAPSALLPRSAVFLYVLEGSLRLGVAGETRALQAGEHAYVPPATSHALANANSGALVRLLRVTAPVA